MTALRLTNICVSRKELLYCEPMDDATDCTGWRQRKKLATREAISAAALSLAVERGFDNLRVSDIAARAGVSPRTYNNYFSSREEAVCALGVDRVRRMADSLRGRPPKEPLTEALRQAMVGDYDVAGPEKAVLFLVVTHPHLRGEFLRGTWGAYRELADAIAERTGRDANSDMLPSIVASAYQSAWRVAIVHWLRDEGPRTLRSVMDEAFAALAPLAASLETTGRKHPRAQARAS